MFSRLCLPSSHILTAHNSLLINTLSTTHFRCAVVRPSLLELNSSAGPKTTRNAAMDDDMVHDKYDEFDAFM